MQRIRLTRRTMRRIDSGMTVVEIAVVIVIIGLLFPLFGLILNMYQDAFKADDKAKMQSQTMQALWYMDDHVRLSNTFMATVPAPYSDAYGPHNSGTVDAEAWSYKGDSATSRVLITRGFATSVNALNTGRQPVFVNTPEFNCSTQMYYQPQLNYMTIYFVRESTLYRRVLTDTSTALCPGNVQSQRQSCPPEIAVGSRHASCQANDEVLATNVTSFTLEYFQIVSDGTSTPVDPGFTSTDPDILAGADYVNATITTSVKNGTITNSVTQRLTKVNQQ